MKSTLLCNLSGYRETIDEVKKEWLHQLLKNLDNYISEDDEWREFAGFSDLLSESAADASYFLFANINPINIIEYQDIDSIQVFWDGNIIGEFGNLRYKIIKKENEKYYEIEFEHWSSFDEPEFDLS